MHQGSTASSPPPPFTLPPLHHTKTSSRMCWIQIGCLSHFLHNEDIPPLSRLMSVLRSNRVYTPLSCFVFETFMGDGLCSMGWSDISKDCSIQETLCGRPLDSSRLWLLSETDLDAVVDRVTIHIVFWRLLFVLSCGIICNCSPENSICCSSALVNHLHIIWELPLLHIGLYSCLADNYMICSLG